MRTSCADCNAAFFELPAAAPDHVAGSRPAGARGRDARPLTGPEGISAQPHEGYATSRDLIRAIFAAGSAGSTGPGWHQPATTERLPACPVPSGLFFATPRAATTQPGESGHATGNCMRRTWPPPMQKTAAQTRSAPVAATATAQRSFRAELECGGAIAKPMPGPAVSPTSSALTLFVAHLHSGASGTPVRTSLHLPAGRVGFEPADCGTRRRRLHGARIPARAVRSLRLRSPRHRPANTRATSDQPCIHPSGLAA